MFMEVSSYILLFFTTSFLGWLMEVVCKLIQFHRFINRGFLLGPICPIYGFGSVLIILLLEHQAENPVEVFILAMVLCGILEYITSYLMEKLFHARWWDYSTKHFNLNGRVCANTLIPFGLLGLVLVYVAKPFFFGLYAMLTEPIRNGLCYALLALFAADTAVSANVLGKIRATATAAKGDSTEAITREVRALLAKSLLSRRTLHAFPHARLENTQLLHRLKEERKALRASTQEARARFQAEWMRKEQEMREEAKRFKEKQQNGKRS